MQEHGPDHRPPMRVLLVTCDAGVIDAVARCPALSPRVFVHDTLALSAWAREPEAFDGVIVHDAAGRIDGLRLRDGLQSAGFRGSFLFLTRDPDLVGGQEVLQWPASPVALHRRVVALAQRPQRVSQAPGRAHGVDWIG